MKKTLTVLAILATFASATPAFARDCGCNNNRGRNPLISADVNVGGRGGLVDIDANVGGSRGRGGLVDVDANILSNGHNNYGNHGGSRLVDVDANVGGRRNGLIDPDVGILGGGVGH
jgi:hypothetical protein